jgi:hypothetical protein
MGRKVRVATHCAILGAAYGAAAGAVFGSLVLPVLGTVLGAWAGGGLGLICGFTAGLVGDLLERAPGWCVAGALGGLVPAALFSSSGFTLDPVSSVLILAVPVLTGCCLGIAIGSGLRTGKSAVPGVGRLAAVISEVKRTDLSTGGVPTEVTPSAAPEGRGTETVPSNG